MDTTNLESIPKEIRGVIVGKLRPMELMMLCGVSKGWLAAAYTPDLRGRRLVEEAARNGTLHVLGHALGLGPMTNHAYVACGCRRQRRDSAPFARNCA